MSILLA